MISPATAGFSALNRHLGSRRFSALNRATAPPDERCSRYPSTPTKAGFPGLRRIWAPANSRGLRHV